MLKKSCGNCGEGKKISKTTNDSRCIICDKMDFLTWPDRKTNIDICWKGKKYDRKKNNQGEGYESK